VQEPRLDRDHQAGPQPQAASGTSVVGDVRVLVHGPPDAVATELEVDAQPGSAGHLTDRGADVAHPVA